MTHRALLSTAPSLAAVLTLLAAACGGGNGTPQFTPTPTNTATPTRTATSMSVPTATPPVTATPTRTPTQSGAAVNGLVVVNRTVMSGNDDVLGAPPALWREETDGTSFDRSLSYADWSIAGTPDTRGVTGPDGSFSIPDLAPGRYTFQATKTLDGNLASMTFPFTVGPDGTADVVAEVAWGLVKSTSTYTEGAVQVRDIRGPYGTWLITHDGRVRELGDPSHSFVDGDGDGQFDPRPCVTALWTCEQDFTCKEDRFCQCVSSCPYCDSCSLPGVCMPAGTLPPYACSAEDTCALPGDRCVCVPSCPDCKDCVRRVCVAGCDPVEITAIRITSGPSQLIVGQQGSVYASAVLSDGSQVDVTYLATWNSSNEEVVTVDSWGTVVARAIGSASLTAIVGTLTSAPWPVEVVERPTLRRIEIQNVSCYYPRGLPPEFGTTPPVAVPPTDANIRPIPSCGQVVQVGSTVQFHAIGEFANGYYEDITDEVQWQVTPAQVGDVAAGLFTARQAGTAKLSASLGGVASDATDIRVVTEPTVVALSIYADNGIIILIDGGPVRDATIPCLEVAPGDSPCCCPGPLADGTVNPCDCGYSITVLRGDEVKFRASAQYDTGDFRDVTDEVSWRSNNVAAATIDEHGVMTAIAGGDASIDAVLGDATSNAVGVHVVDHATLQSLYINQEGDDRVVAKGDQRFFKATGNYDIGFGRDVTSEASWHSSDESVGGFETPGVFIARTAGIVQVWAELDGQRSNPLSLEVFQTSELEYCDPAHINRATWSDDFNRVTLESDCDQYRQPGVVALRYTVTEHTPHGGIFDPCLDLYVYRGDTRVRTIREERCGDPFVPSAAPGRDEALLKFQLRAFWDLKGEDGQPVPPGIYTVYGRFYLYYDPVVSIDVAVLSPDGTLPTRTPTPTPGPVCTPPLCGPDEVLHCPGSCPGGCGVVCVRLGNVASLDVGSATGLRGETVQFAVSLHAAGQQVAGTQNDLLFDPTVAVAARANGRPDCAVNADIDKSASAFVFIPAGCRAGFDCKGLRAIVVATDNVDPIPDGSLLYRCSITIPSDAASGSYPLIAAGVVASGPNGDQVPITGSSGEIVVVSRPGETPPTHTPTPTAFPVCSPPQCNPDQTLFCPDECPGGCGVVCVTPGPTPVPEGWCFQGADCQGGASPTSQGLCCTLARESLSPLPFTWCPLDQFDPSSGRCAECHPDPCEGLPPPPPTPPPSIVDSVG